MDTKIFDRLEEIADWATSGDASPKDIAHELNGLKFEFNNPSKICMENSKKKAEIKLMKAKEFDRGYQLGKQAKTADEWTLDRDRQEVLDRLKDKNPDYWCLDALFEDDKKVITNKMLYERLIYLLGGK